MKRFALMIALAAAAAVQGGPRVFDFADPKGVNGMQVLLDTPLEPIVGIAGGVRGTVRFDPAEPASLSGFIEVDPAAISFVNPMMTKVAHGKDWLDVEAHSVLRFDIGRVVGVRPGESGRLALAIEGTFTCRGIAKPLTVEVSVHHLPGRLGDRVKGQRGDLLVLRGEFSVKRTEFGLRSDPGFVLVADDVQIRFGIVGLSPDP